MIASSIMTSRALAPIELAIAHWKGFVAARQSWQRLKQLLPALPRRRNQRDAACADELARGRECQRRAARRTHAGGRPGCELSRSARGRARHHRPERLGQVVAGARACRASGCRCAARSGSTARRSTSGRPRAGRTYRLSAAGRQLFAGTIAQNIARFEPDAPSEAVICAAPRRPACMISIVRCPTATRRGSARRDAAVGRPAAAHRARARALWRSVPGRARRAEFQSRCGRRRGPDRAPSWAFARAAASSSSSPIDPAPWPASIRCW